MRVLGGLLCVDQIALQTAKGKSFPPRQGETGLRQEKHSPRVPDAESTSFPQQVFRALVISLPDIILPSLLFSSETEESVQTSGSGGMHWPETIQV